MSVVASMPPEQRLLRIPLLLSLAATVAAVAVMVSAVAHAAELAAGSYRERVLFAASGFGLSVALCLVTAALLLLIDRFSGSHYRAQPAQFGLVALLGALTVVVNVAAAVDQLTFPASGIALTSVVGGKAAACAASLAPAALAGFAVWVGFLGMRPTNQEIR